MQREYDERRIGICRQRLAEKERSWIIPWGKKRTVESYLPLTSALFHVLLALADGEKHGYVISKEIARRTNNEVKLSTGTLYGIIKRLLENSMIEESAERPDFSLDDQRRRYYRLTKLGEAVAEAEAERMERVLALARAKHVLGPQNA